MTAPAPAPAPDARARNRRTLWILLGLVAGLSLATFLLVSFYFPKRRVRAPEELREKLKPRLHGTIELSPQPDAAPPANSAPASSPIPVSPPSVPGNSSAPGAAR